MEQEEVKVEHIADQEELAEVASLIRPLPDNVIPSDEFLRRTRMRLLRLEGKEDSNNQQAA